MAKLTAEELQEVFDIIEPYVGENTGHSGEWVYGNYVEWQKIDDLSEDTIRCLCDYFNIDFEGKTEEICEQLREMGVPEETAYEYEEDFPEQQGYWYEPYSIDDESYVDEIEKIEQLVIESRYELVKKSLILSALIFTESFVNSKITDKINLINIIKETDPALKKLIDNSVLNNLWRKEVRKNTCKLLFDDESLGIIPSADLRDSLAHNIRGARIEDNKIYYKAKNGKENDKEIPGLFKELKEFAERLMKFEG